MLTEKQKIVLKLYSEDEDIAKISQKTGYSRNSIYYALKSGQNNLNKATFAALLIKQISNKIT